ncbi:MAG: hypothetical protein HC821_03620 [Lewinella sp.]|nr:hypothetical protein [Lewinella sp.]
MVGYKITPILSVGPRVSIAYNAYSLRNTGNNDFKSKFWTYSAGLFARARIINPFFAHFEYGLESDVIGFIGEQAIRRTRSVPYIGAGHSPFNPGGISTEVLVLFRLGQGNQIINEAPFVIRAGINFNF